MNNLMLKSIITGAFLIASVPLFAQHPINGAYLDTITTTADQSKQYVKDAANGAATSLSGKTGITYFFGSKSGYSDNKKQIKAITAGGFGYTYTNDIDIEVRIQRNQADTSAMTGYKTDFPSVHYDVPNVLRDMAYYEGRYDTATKSVLAKSGYSPSLADLFVAKDISIGIDNLFANKRVTNFNNIERIDVISAGGLAVTVPSATGFAIFERGVHDVHDPCVLGLITSLDMDGNPASYSDKFIQIQATNYNVAGSSTNHVYQQPSDGSGYIILRRDNQTDSLQVSDIISNAQGIGGVLLTFEDFAISSGATIYGYSVFANDFYTTNGNSTAGMASHAVDYKNTTYFPLNTSDVTGAGGIDLATVAGMVKIMNLKGNVFHDYNGLTDSVVGGTPINNPNGTFLFVNLINQDGKVVGATAVNADGTFELERVGFGELILELSINKGIIGEDAPLSILPKNWGFAGEHYGNYNYAGNGNDYIGINDGKIAIRIQDFSIDNVNFGIEQYPDTDTFETTLGDLSFGDTLTLTALSSLPELSGEDPEEGIFGNGATYIFTDLSKMEGNTFYYDGAAVYENQIIKNYNPDLLTVVLTGIGSTSFTFEYMSVDTAGLADPTPAFYKVDWSSPLPVSLLDFAAKIEGDAVKLSWTTASEKDNQGFVVEKSVDTKKWNTIGFVNGSGTSTEKINYSYSDLTPVNGINYYRLKQLDWSGEINYSEVASVSLNSKTGQILLYPNPANDKVSIIVLKPLSITLLNAVGQTVDVVVDIHDDVSLLSVGQLPSGIYMVLVQTEAGNSTAELIVN